MKSLGNSPVARVAVVALAFIVIALGMDTLGVHSTAAKAVFLVALLFCVAAAAKPRK